jgi:hypothetical protein
MSERPDIDRRVTDWLRSDAQSSAPKGVLAAALDRVAGVGQERPFGGRPFDAWIGRSPRLHWAIVIAALAAAALLGAVAGAGALWRQTTPQLNLAPPADLQAFVLSTYDRMPAMPPVAITTITDGVAKDRMYVSSSGAVRFDHFATRDALAPDTYEILNGTTKGQVTTVGSGKAWVEQTGAISEDPRVFLVAAMLGGAASQKRGCEVTRNRSEVGDGTAASGWTWVDAESVIGRPTQHVTCGGGDLWIDAETRLILRSRGPLRDQALKPVPGALRTIEVTDLEFGEQPSALFELAQPAGVPRAVALAAKVMGAGSYPGVTVVAPSGWQVSGGSFVDPPSGPVLGVSVWDVGQVPRDPCHSQGQLSDPGPTVDDLVRALVAQPLRQASTPTSVTLAGYPGQYFEWSVPSTMVVTGDADFKGCDVQPSNGHLDYVSWSSTNGDERFQQVAGQVDRVWVLNVKGQRLVVDATHTPAATQADLADQEHIVESLRFVSP